MTLALMGRMGNLGSLQLLFPLKPRLTARVQAVWRMELRAFKNPQRLQQGALGTAALQRGCMVPDTARLLWGLQWRER